MLIFIVEDEGPKSVETPKGVSHKNNTPKSNIEVAKQRGKGPVDDSKAEEEEMQVKEIHMELEKYRLHKMQLREEVIQLKEEIGLSA